MRVRTFLLWYLAVWLVLITGAVIASYSDGIDGQAGVYAAFLWGLLANLVSAFAAIMLSVRR